MSQSDKMSPTKFSLLPGSITRFFLLMIIVLLVTGQTFQSLNRRARLRHIKQLRHDA